MNILENSFKYGALLFEYGWDILTASFGVRFETEWNNNTKLTKN